MSLTDRVASAVARRSRLVVAALLVATLVVGAGASAVEESTSVESLASGSPEAAANEQIRDQFAARENVTRALVAVHDPDGNALSKASLLRTLRYQRAVRENETVAPTLVDRQPTRGLGNVVARTAMRESDETANASGAASPSLSAQIAHLESMDAAAVERVVERVLDADGSAVGRQARAFLPRSYDPGTATASTRLVVVTQRTDQPIRTGAAVSEDVSEGQLAVRDVAKAQSGPEIYRVFGRGLITAQESAAISDSLAIVGPLAVAFVLVALSVAYRDALDVALGLGGVVVVLVWTFGAMGWLGVDFNQVMIAVPILLVGLSVDYALHVVMRYREERDDDLRDGMAAALRGVGPALALVTLTTAIGFLANLTSPVGDLREFGVVTAIGITATLVVFGLLVPAVKTELDAFLEARGFDRSASAFGTGRLRGVLSGGASLARRAPVAVLVVAVLVSAGGAYGATGIDTSFSSDAFVADDPPEWTDDLPGSMAPGEYYLKDNRAFVYERFQSPDKQGQILVEGEVTEPGTLDAIADAEAAAADAAVTVDRPNGDPAVLSPLAAMQRVAARDDAFAATLRASDTDDDGVPDTDLAGVYDAFHDAAPDLAGRTVARENGEYTALRLRVGVLGTADRSPIDRQLRAVAAEIEDDSPDLTATATGRPVVAKVVTEDLTETVVESLAVTLLAVLALLAAAFRITEGSASLGAVTLVPVLFAVSWLLGTMAALDVPISLITALVGSISVGLGVDYAIHVSERFSHELDASADAAAALERTVVGTGGALLSSAVTTAAGFGVLTFSLLPGLRQFGFVLAVGIAYAFVASVLVQPSLLALWRRYTDAATTRQAAVAPGDD